MEVPAGGGFAAWLLLLLPLFDSGAAFFCFLLFSAEALLTSLEDPATGACGAFNSPAAAGPPGASLGAEDVTASCKCLLAKMRLRALPCGVAVSMALADCRSRSAGSAMSCLVQ